ncbi:MFS transporter [Streptomyces niger]|uniref:MFS transporter n=1 Tax=Streptomyces niger TaxID=66373 RepID=UPI00069C3B39|nr:MFS transporter [Streptomyces niger]
MSLPLPARKQAAPPPSHAETPPRAGGRPSHLLTFAPLLANADAGVVALALPHFQQDLGMGLAGAQWVSHVYVLLVGAVQLAGGRLADLAGALRLFRCALAGFAVAAACCALAPTGGALIAARGGQAVAAALLVPSAMALLVARAPGPTARVRALGRWARAGGLGSVAGIVLGGLVLSRLGWRWAFWLDVPVALGMLYAARRLEPVPVFRRASGAGAGLWGAIWLSGALLALMYALVHLPQQGLGTSDCGALLAAVLLGLLFAASQRRTAAPLLPSRVLRARGLLGGSAGVFLVAAATGPVGVIGSLYLQGALHYGPLGAGLAMLPMVGGIIVVGRVCCRLLARRGPRLPYLVGWALIGAGLLLLTGVSADSAYLPSLLPGLLLIGCGMPFIWMTCEVVALSGVGPCGTGIGAGIVQSAGQLGGALGLAMAVTVVTARAGGSGPLSGAGAAALSEGAGQAFLAAAVLVLPALANAWAGLGGQRPAVTTRSP